MGYGVTDFATGNTPGASDFDGIMRQTTMAFATVAARNSALTGLLAEGMRAYTEDANTFWWYNGSAWVIETEPPQAWSPTVSQGGSVGATVNWGWSQRRNGTWFGDCKLTVTGTGTAGNIIAVTTPFTVVTSGGSVRVWDDSIGWGRVGVVIPINTGEMAIGIDQGTAEYGVHAGDGLTADDVLWFSNVGGVY